MLPRDGPSRSLGCEGGSAVAAMGSLARPTPFTVHVRALHALDLDASKLDRRCPVLHVSVNNGAPQNCMAAQHAKNHSIWRRHALSFKLEESEWFSIQVEVLRGSPPMPTSARGGKTGSPVELGSLGELRLPVKKDDYELTQFFQLFRRVRAPSATPRNTSPYTLAPAGRIKLRIQFKVTKLVELPATAGDKPPSTPAVAGNPPSRSLFGGPSSFLESLQLQRKKLKATVVPVTPTELSAAGSHSVGISDTDPGFFARETALISVDHIVTADELQYVEEKAIGEGAHSYVRQARLIASSRALRGGNAHVAVKEFRYMSAGTPPRKVVEAFLREYRILTRLPRTSEHVTTFEGVVLQPKLAILMGFCTHGSIAQLISDKERWRQVSLMERWRITLQLAKGIACLHKHDIVHRDIKPHNILLTPGIETGEQLVAKVGDLGSAAVHPRGAPPLMEEAGSSGYTAPEVFSGCGYDFKVDVWSFAILSWEVIAPSPRPGNPFVGLDSDEFVRRASEGVRPDITRLGQHGRSLQRTELSIRRIIETCWAFSPADRPTMDEVVRSMEQIRES